MGLELRIPRSRVADPANHPVRRPYQTTFQETQMDVEPLEIGEPLQGTLSIRCLLIDALQGPVSLSV